MWTPQEKEFLVSLGTPWGIQLYLNSLRYNKEETCKSPRGVLREKSAHCAEGAYFAAAALEVLGHPPKVVDLRAVNDDDHIIAVFREAGLWGAVAKSNTTVLRYREPAYRSLRELVMSYFDFYFNTKGQKTLRSFSRPLDLRRFDLLEWRTTEGDLNCLGDCLDSRPHLPLLTEAAERHLAPTDEALLEAGFLGAVREGLFEPET